MVRQIQRDHHSESPAKRRAAGWFRPAAMKAHRPLDHLAAEGFDYVCDWGFDDQPMAPCGCQSGRMIAIPYQQGLNDIRVIFQGGHTPKDWLRDGLRSLRHALRRRRRAGAGDDACRSIRSSSAWRFASNISIRRWSIFAPTTASGKRPAPRSPIITTHGFLSTIRNTGSLIMIYIPTAWLLVVASVRRQAARPIAW